MLFRHQQCILLFLKNIYICKLKLLYIKILVVKFQKTPTVKNVKLIARRKSMPKVFIKSIVTSNPVPEEIDPFKTPIIKIKIKNLIFLNKLRLVLPDDKPKSDLKNE